MKENNSTNIVQTIVVVLVIIAATLAGMTSLAMPAVVPASAPAEEFSAERAMQHIRIISQAPHPTGSLENAQARDYIISQLEALGLSPEVQQTTVVMPPGKDSISASTVYNIIARIPGTNSSGAILLDAHYDTMQMTPGATDCTSCVATLLETARALQAAPPLQNDVILLFTDKEESSDDADGKEGVAAFIEQHPWASEVRQVLNFDGTGRTGPAMLIETGPNSGWLVREWGRVASQPVAQSWFYEIFRLTPIGTDFRSYANAGIGGLNFFYLFENAIYHTVLDNPERIDPRSVQHFGSNALSMTRRLGNLNLAEAQRPGDAVYFSLFRGLLVNYPAAWAIPLVFLAGLLLVGAAVVGFWRGQLTLQGLLFGLSASLLSVIAAPGLATGLWIGIVQLHGVYQSFL
ncbi:MAG TPA: M28 family peptidase, partial [Anaerolineales bacterium]|nr:M28 family peptidase [Anaerolineales bacterium]